jgi:hypothetical protein
MTDSLGPPGVLVGLIRLREHCAFSWEEPERGGLRIATVRSSHCPECIAELRKLGYILLSEGPEGGSATGGRRP